MSSVQNTTSVNSSDEISIKAVLAKLKQRLKYLRSKWLLILIVSLIGGGLGIAYAMVRKEKFVAVCNFVLDDNSKGGSLSQYAGLASLAGIDIPGGNTGMFQGDNIIELYKSRLMIEKTLLCKADFNGHSELLIDRYINFNGLREEWKKTDHIDNVSFNGSPDKFTRKQDSIITDIVNYFNKKLLTVDKADKKLSIITVKTISNDELFAKAFTIALVENVNSFYAQTKTKKTVQNVNILQRQADSVRAILNSSLYGVASASDAVPNSNPYLQSLKVPSQKKQVDVQASGAIYSEIVKNLELSKISLRQETPLMQVIDEPVLPLLSDKLSRVKGFIMGFIIGFFLILIAIITRKVYSNLSK